MKKILVLVAILLLTGCKSQLECVKESQSEDYNTEENLIFEFDKNDKINGATLSYVMTFKDEEQAKSYSKIFETLDTNYEIKVKDNKITVVTQDNYSKYSQNKDELKSELEENGYSCKNK